MSWRESERNFPRNTRRHSSPSTGLSDEYYAIHLEEDGAGYRATKEPFLYGIPLPLTDAVIGEDGAFYSPSADETPKVRSIVSLRKRAHPPGATLPNPARETRRALEAYHGKVDAQAVTAALPKLSSDDRFLRHAARVAIESQPSEQWADLVLTAESPQARITGSVALARSGDPEKHRSAILTALLKLDPSSLPESQPPRAAAGLRPRLHPPRASRSCRADRGPLPSWTLFSRTRAPM